MKSKTQATSPRIIVQKGRFVPVTDPAEIAELERRVQAAKKAERQAESRKKRPRAPKP